MSYVAVRSADGHDRIGSAFHVGSGIFVTARHVVEQSQIIEVKPTHPLRRPIQEAIPEYTNELVDQITAALKVSPTWPIFQNALRVTKGPFFHKDSTLDVAVFQTEGLHPATPYVPLGSHLDDWIGETDFVLSEALVLGYPPIPLTREPHLVAARAEVNSVVNLVHTSKAHFILSATPRGGFSGGLALSEGGFALGVITSSLAADHVAAELGFMAVMSIEPIYECLAAYKLLPDCQKENWEDFWNTDNLDFVTPVGVGASEIKATVSLHDDGRTVYVGLYCRERRAMDAALEAIVNSKVGSEIEISHTSEMHARICFAGTPDNVRSGAKSIVASASEIMISLGYTSTCRNPTD